METDSMSCPHHPNVAYVLVGEELICPECGRYSPHQHKPTYEQLQTENAKLRERIKQLEPVIEIYPCYDEAH